MAVSNSGQCPLVHSLAKLLRNDGDLVLDGSSTLTLTASSLQQLTRMFEQYLLPRTKQHGFLALPSHPADTASLLQLQFLFDVLQKTVSLKLINPPSVRLQSVVKIFPFKSLKYLELKQIPPHCLEGLRGVYSQLEVFTCSKSLNTLEELLSLCGGDMSSALPWLELHTLNFSYNSIVCLDQSLSLLNALKSLDLSHNKIQECAEFLKPLSELQHLNLSYNCLQRAPALDLSSRAKLVTLNLRNNELETINGVEQLSSLQHLDLAYNLLLEHSQLAPLSLLHCLSTLNLQGNPLYFQKTHRSCTVRHLSLKAANHRLKLDGVALSSSELSVLPKLGLLIQSQSAPPVAEQPERSNQEVSSGAGELTDSVSVPEIGASNFQKKRNRSKVKVRRASISEPSDTDYDTRWTSSTEGFALPHQQEIERMSSFRDQLGDDWLRYQHHLDGSSSDKQPRPQTSSLPSDGIVASVPPSAPKAPEVLPPSQHSPGTAEPGDVDGEQDTESTLRWPGHSPQPAESTLEDSVVDGPSFGQTRPSAESKLSAKGDSEGSREEEEEDLGVDLCHPLLVGVLSDKEEEDAEWKNASSSSSRRRREVFLCIKQGLVLEVDVQHGRERCRLELSSLARLEATEAAWTRGETQEVLPAVELYFDYISKDKRRRRYILLDDDPHHALQALTDVLTSVMAENQQHQSDLRPSCARLQCLRCRSEVACQKEGGEQQEEGEAIRRRMKKALMLTGTEEEQDEEQEPDRADEGRGSVTICPECGSDQVVQLAGPHSSTPINNSSIQDSDISLQINQSLQELSKDDGTDASISGSSIPEAGTTAEDPTFVTARGSSFFIGDAQGDVSSVSSNADSQSKDGLFGSYCYTSTGATPPELHPPPAGRSTPHDDLDLLSEDYSVVDHRLQLFLDVEVFEEEEEVLHSFLKMSAVRFGELGEVPSLLVVSDRRIYFLEMTSENHKDQLSDWLQKRDSHPIVDLSYLEVGLGSQTIHMQFGEGGAAYTLLVRDSLRCKRFFSLLTGIVREMAHRSDSMLRSISTTRLSSQHHLWPLVCEDIQADVEDGQLQFYYILAFVLQGDIWKSLTVLATRETLYLLQEDHQWRKRPAVTAQAQDQDQDQAQAQAQDQDQDQAQAQPSSGAVTVLESLPISCVSSLHLWRTDGRRMDIELYDETEKQEKTWCIRADGAELLQGLLAWVRAQWEAMFGVKLQTRLHD